MRKEFEEEHEHKDEVIKSLKQQALLKQQVNENLGINPQYNQENRSKLWDSHKDKLNFKDQVFGNNQTIVDPISEKVIHKSQKATQRKYHMRNGKGEKISIKWAARTAETDHINSLKKTHSKVKHNPFLTNQDFKEIMNTSGNYRILSKKDNAAKGDLSDWNLVFNKKIKLSKKAKTRIAKQKIKSDLLLSQKFTLRTVKNVSTEFAQGAKDTVLSSVIPLTVEGVQKLCDVASGKQSLKQAAKDMGKSVVDVAVVGGKHRLVQDIVYTQLKNSNNPALKSMANSNQVTQIVHVAIIVQETAVRYVNGEINGKQFVEEIGAKGTMMVAGMIGGNIGGKAGAIAGGVLGSLVMPGVGTATGMIAGEVIGQLLGTIITTTACSAIISFYQLTKRLDHYKYKERQIRALETQALQEMERQRAKFNDIVLREFKHWDEEIQQGFDLILTSACEATFNLQGVTDGLDKILSLFGKNVAFKTVEQYEAQLDSPLKLKF